MKKQFLLTILMVVTTFAVLKAEEKQTSYFADTLNITISKDLRLTILSGNISKYQPADTLNKTLTEFLKDIMAFEWPEMDGRYFRIFYSIDQLGNANIKFKDVTDEEKTWLVLENGETLPPMPVDIVIKQSKETELHCYLSGMEKLEQLTAYNIEGLITKVIESQKIVTPEIRRVAMTATWDAPKAVPAKDAISCYRNTQIGDQIELSGTVGASLIRNQLVPSFDLMLGVTIANKTRIKHMVKADISVNYIFNEKPEGGFLTNINTFIGASYFINTANNPDKPYWYGIGVSYLAWRNGDFFDKNTWRVSLGAKFGDHFSVMPELYISDGFKKVMPGMKFRIWF